ncbi:guanylate kinase [Odoribacter laneus]|jgi:guanylate kinase|uniref:guanylate kinase n=2 Tax=Odoribacter laneus TaxID=626933 RepID=UPI00033CF14F|nr:guanylate kinase [Odoribacter laneus]CCZ80986.1 guanylate kinase [Odoribacter laneus CAG:561]
MTGKVIIFSAPSGAGKSTIVNYLLSKNLGLEFSISATCRPPRGKEQHGKEYYFFTQDDFKKKIAAHEFLEWEEVYPGCFYGTLQKEVERIWAKGQAVLFDVDVKGGVNIKKKFGDQALSIFIQAPSIDILKKRLISRATDSPEKIEERVAKAEYEMSFASQFDTIIVNDNLETAQKEAEQKVKAFLAR